MKVTVSVGIFIRDARNLLLITSHQHRHLHGRGIEKVSLTTMSTREIWFMTAIPVHVDK